MVAICHCIIEISTSESFISHSKQNTCEYDLDVHNLLFYSYFNGLSVSVLSFCQFSIHSFSQCSFHSSSNMMFSSCVTMNMHKVSTELDFVEAQTRSDDSAC